MTIIEAAAEANWRGRSVICRRTADGSTIAVRFTPYIKSSAAVYDSDCRLSEIVDWVPALSDILATDWRMFHPEWYAIPDKPQEPETKPETVIPQDLLRLPIRSPEFRDALKAAGADGIYAAADTLEDMLKLGFAVKGRLQAVNKEISIREEDRK